MLQKNKSQRIALAKYGLSAPLFILMLVLSSATISNSKTVKSLNQKIGTILLTPADDVITGITDNGKISDYFVVNTDTVPSKNVVFTVVEKQPEFPGGTTAFGHFLGSNIHYPIVDRNNRIQGKVLLRFIVERDGSLTDIKAIVGPSETLKGEAVRVMKQSPKWKPGYQNNELVRVAYNVPINFSLN